MLVDLYITVRGDIFSVVVVPVSTSHRYDMCRASYSLVVFWENAVSYLLDLSRFYSRLCMMHR